LIPEAGALYVLDGGDTDFARLYRLSLCRALFVIRAKRKMNFRRLYSHPVDRSTGLICDQTIVLTGRDTAKAYPAKLRRVRSQDPETGKKLTFVTNDFSLPALTIAKLYRSRWQVELFFRWTRAAPADQGVLRHLAERRAYANLDRHLGLRARGDREKAARGPAESTLRSTGP
jgi:hypothetical protein